VRILVVTQYYWPEHFRINDLAKGLVERGHHVTVLTGCPNYPDGEIFQGYSWWNKQETHEGVYIIRVPIIPRGSSSSIRLLLNYLSFAVSASVLGPFLCKGGFDSIFVCQLSPVTVAIPGILLKRLKKAPLTMWILDLWPESLSAAGGIQSPWIINLTSKLVRFIYKKCDKILISSKGFQKSVQAQGVEFEQLHYFPNWVEPIPSVSQKQELNLPMGFRIIFAGNIGVSQDFETILCAAERLKSINDIHWIILGEGRQLNWVKDQIRFRKLTHCFHLMGRFPPEAMPAFFEAADALLVTLKPDPVFALTVPGKVQSYMAHGKPILAALDGEGAKLIQDTGSGLVVPSGDTEGLVFSILKLKNFTPEEKLEMGKRGHKIALSNFNRETQLDKLEGYFEDLTTTKLRFTGFL